LSTPEQTLDRLLLEKQRERLPSVSAAVVRRGEIVWQNAAGWADYDEDRLATPETQYRIGSVTKMFTAVAVMQLRDAGALDLDDRLEVHVEEVRGQSPTIRRLLSHLTGMQREAGDMWATGQAPTDEELLASLADVEYVLGPAQAHHYSNLAFALLGLAVSRVSGVDARTYVDERILGPLGLSRTTWAPQPPFAQGYLVDEYANTVWREPHDDIGATGSAGQLWSTVGDLARWAAFLAAGDERVLRAATVEEMWFPQVMYFPDEWIMGWGLGLQLFNRDGRIWGGHGGAMAGHLAGVYVDRKTQVGAAALTNSGTRGDMDGTAISFAARAIELWPEELEPWRPEEEPPPDIRRLLGRWWSEGMEFVFWWEGGALRARAAAAPPGRAPAIFERTGENELRAVSGRERGERLRVEGDRLLWAGYPFTRAQEPSPGAPQ
jgi:CubicO group peptidase (beta-lactamase class C family)